MKAENRAKSPRLTVPNILLILVKQSSNKILLEFTCRDRQEARKRGDGEYSQPKRYGREPEKGVNTPSLKGN